MSDRLEEIAAAVGREFRTFGGGRTSEWNPIASALAGEPLQFAAGVDVRAVVAFVLDAAGVDDLRWESARLRGLVHAAAVALSEAGAPTAARLILNDMRASTPAGAGGGA